MCYDKDDEIYTVKPISNQDYQKLFKEITKCGMRGKYGWKKKNGKKFPVLKHHVYTSYEKLDFRHLLDFLKKLSGDDLIEFKSAIDNSAIQWDSFSRGRNRNISPHLVQTGICTAAKFLKIPLISLLARLLEHCEANKVRLSCHSEYEEVIESFLREAPGLVAQLQLKSSQPFTQENQKQPPEQITPEKRHRIERVENKKKWLSPCNYDALPLVGRKKEIKQLDKFIESDGQFKIWAITGPSGSGKTRLAFQWAYFSKELDGWDCRILHKEDRTKPKQWGNWSPTNSTLIIIDYMYGFEKVVLKLMRRRFKSDKHKIRLLLIDHVFSKELHTDERWGFSGDQESHDRNEKFFHDLSPLDLEETENQEEIIKSIIAKRAGIDIENNQVIEAHNYLLDTEGAYRPLFAALVADAIISGKDFRVWNRRELINYYLSGEKRLPWENKDLALNGLWASYFIAAATARRGIRYKDLIKASSNCSSRPKNFRDVKKVCKKVVTDVNANILAPLEPDILGESFFLQFLQYLEEFPEYQVEFRQVFIAGNVDAQTEDITKLIVFTQRLTRNLLHDDQAHVETRELWNIVFEFMNPSNFKSAEPIRWAMTAGIIDCVNVIKEQFLEKEIIAFLEQIEPNVFFYIHNSSPSRTNVLSIMRYFELTKKIKKINPTFSEEMFKLFDKYTENNSEFDTPLIIAVYRGFTEIIDMLIKRGADVKTTILGGKNLLHMASGAGQTEVVKQLLKTGLNINATEFNGTTALHSASNIEVAELLLKKGANINATASNGNTKLIDATFIGHTKMVELLLNKRADVHTKDMYGCTALIWASIKGYVAIARLLLDKKANIDAASENGRTALIWASLKGRSTEIVKLLLDKKANIHTADNDNHTALLCACIEGHTEIVKLLLDKKANTHTADNDNRTALIRASYHGHTEIVKLLLDKKANIHTVDNDNRTALIWASIKGHTEIVKLLLDKKANIHAADKDDITALIWASIKGHIEIVKLLLDKKANIHAIIINGRTALTLASLEGRVEVVKLLLDEGAEINSADSEGRTALSTASNDGHVDVVRLLLDKGADIHAADKWGNTALLWASLNGHVEVAKLLLDQGAKINATDNMSRTPLFFASVRGHDEMVKLLLKRKPQIHIADSNGQTALSVATTKGHKEIIKLFTEHGTEG